MAMIEAKAHQLLLLLVAVSVALLILAACWPM